MHVTLQSAGNILVLMQSRGFVLISSEMRPKRSVGFGGRFVFSSVYSLPKRPCKRHFVLTSLAKSLNAERFYSPFERGLLDARKSPQTNAVLVVGILWCAVGPLGVPDSPSGVVVHGHRMSFQVSFLMLRRCGISKLCFGYMCDPESAL